MSRARALCDPTGSSKHTARKTIRAHAGAHHSTNKFAVASLLGCKGLTSSCVSCWCGLLQHRRFMKPALLRFLKAAVLCHDYSRTSQEKRHCTRGCYAAMPFSSVDFLTRGALHSRSGATSLHENRGTLSSTTHAGHRRLTRTIHLWLWRYY